MPVEEHEHQRRIQEGRMRKGRQTTTASHQKERQEVISYVPKTRRRRDVGIGGKSGSRLHMDYSKVVDLTQAHECARYAEGFNGYDRIEEDTIFYVPEEEAPQFYQTEEVALGKDDEAEDDDGHGHGQDGIKPQVHGLTKVVIKEYRSDREL